MNHLPEYQNIVRETLDALEPLVQKYGGSDSPLDAKDAAALQAAYRKAQHHCTERLKTGLPKIMLYGLYNSGKSTLLNALMGEEVASVGDWPETHKVTPYQWQGYEILDTPGINAPTEHEKVSREALGECQVILFVLSAAGSFENKAIYEAMHDVVQRDKQLFIVLNDKAGAGLEADALAKAKQAVQRHLIDSGLDCEKAADFRLCLVNAQLALEGRLEGDERIVDESGIRELERLAAEEIKRVNGFAVVADLCAYLLETFKPFIDVLARLGDDKGTNPLQDYFAIREEYHNFCAELERKANEACADMPATLFSCFPKVEGEASPQQVTEDEIKSKINAVWKDYDETIHVLRQQEVTQYLDRLSAQLQTMLDALPEQECSTSSDSSEEKVREIWAHLCQHPQETPPDPVNIPGNEMCDKIEAAGALLGGGGIAALLKFIPIPPLLLPVLALVPLFRICFGKSDAELHNERVAAEAAAKRRAEEEHARNVALWRQELQNHCQDMTAHFLRAVKKNRL